MADDKKIYTIKICASTSGEEKDKFARDILGKIKKRKSESECKTITDLKLKVIIVSVLWQYTELIGKEAVLTANKYKIVVEEIIRHIMK